MDTVSKVLSLILIVFLLVIAPLYREFWVEEQLVYNHVNNATSKFSKNVRMNGSITKESYEEFTRELSKTNRTYNIQMTYKKIKYYPLDSSDPRYTTETPYLVLSDTYNERSLLEKLYDKENVVDAINMNQGDEFSVTATDATQSKYTTLKGMLRKGDAKTYIFATYGGVIENEVN